MRLAVLLALPLLCWPAAACAQLSPPTDFAQTNFPADLQKLKDIAATAHQALKAAQDACAQRLQSDPQFQSLNAKYQTAKDALESAIASGDGVADAAQAKMDAGSQLTLYEHDKIAADPPVAAAQAVADAADGACDQWIKDHHYTSADEVVHMVPALTWLSQLTDIDRYYWGAQFFRKIDAELNQVVCDHPAVLTVTIKKIEGGTSDVLHATDITTNHLTIHQHAAVTHDDSISEGTLLQISGLLHATTEYEDNGFVLDISLLNATVLKSQLTLVCSADNATPNRGSNVVYTVKLTNTAGPTAGTATNVKIKDSVSDGQTLVSTTASPGTTFANGIWTIPELDAGAAVTLLITAKSTDYDEISNSAAVTTEDEPNATPIPKAVATVQTQQTKLKLEGQVDEPWPNVGDLVNITVTLRSGDGSNATGVAVTDLLPSGLSFQSASPSQGTYDQQKGIWNVGSLAAGGNATLALSALATTTGEADDQATLTAADQPNEQPSPQATIEINVHTKPPPPAPPPKPAIPPWAIPVGIGVVVLVIIILRR
jgi:uncharacterized repeat protein (TIGR01451 family)